MLTKLLQVLKKSYSQSIDDIVPHRDMIGYVCIVNSGNHKYILKLFRSTYTKQALQSIEIMKYLYNAGYPTAHILSTVNEMLYFNFEDQGNSRIGVLYEFINGEEPDKYKDIELIGQQTGLLHHLMKDFPGILYPHGKPFYIDRYINILKELNYPDMDKFQTYGDLLWRRVEMLPSGFCHGDYHTGNMLLNSKGQYVLFDFDAAGNAFSLYDIAVICDATNYFTLSDHEYADTTRLLERFLKGYTRYKSISDQEIQSIYNFIAIRHYEVQATIIENLGLSCVDKQFIDSQYEWLINWEKLST